MIILVDFFKKVGEMFWHICVYSIYEYPVIMLSTWVREISGSQRYFFIYNVPEQVDDGTS